MHVFLETERLILRRFTDDDVDVLVELDSDPDVMFYITGGRPTPRDEIETDILPAFLSYYERFAGYGFWAVVERSTGRLPRLVPLPARRRSRRATSPSSAIGCGSRRGARATSPRVRSC